MIFLLKRPIAVGICFLASAIFSIIALRQLPVSLLPELEVPALTVRVEYPNASPAEVEENLLRPLRAQLASLAHLNDLESQAFSEVGFLHLSFDFGTAMDFTYIEANEKVDRFLGNLPAGVPRPKVIKTNTADIPVVHLQIQQANGNERPPSELAENVLRKRLEAIEGVSLVDVNGLARPCLYVRPKQEAIEAFGADLSNIMEAVRQYTQPWGGISVKDGQYRFYVKLASQTQRWQDLGQIPVQIGKNFLPLYTLATWELAEERPMGKHLFNGQEGILFTLHKQSSEQLSVFSERVRETVAQMAQEYPELQFQYSQDQSELLQTSLSNLQTSLLYGATFACLVLLLFMGNWRAPLMIAISLPISLLLGFWCFSWVGLSVNVVSLSGLALGIGMLIDNGIVVIDNVSRKLKASQAANFQEGLLQACANGTTEVMAPLLSSTLTTLAVFVPLVFMNGLSGALFKDQAMAIGITLSTSLLVAFVLLPLLYKGLFSRGSHHAPEDTKLFAAVLAWYERLHHHLLKNPLLWGIGLALLLPISVWLLLHLPVQGLPTLEKYELAASIHWQEPIGLEENTARMKALSSLLQPNAEHTESEVGVRQFLMQAHTGTLEEASLYARFPSEASFVQGQADLLAYMARHYPNAKMEVGPVPNAFSQLFASRKPYFEVRLSNTASHEPLALSLVQAFLAPFEGEYEAGKGADTQTTVYLKPNEAQLLASGFTRAQLLSWLQQTLGGLQMADFRDLGNSMPIRLAWPKASLQALLHQRQVPLPQQPQRHIPLSSLVSVAYTEEYRELPAGAAGVFQSVNWKKQASYDEVMEQCRAQAAKVGGMTVSFSGAYFDERAQLQQLAYILGVAVLLLFFVLAAQFESLWQPLLVLLTLPLGLGGSALMLWLSGGSLNVMSAIGLVVMLGIMVNDAILKIDTINQLVRKEGMDLKTALLEAGRMRLKAILMTSATTILALLPVLFSTGLGHDLQAPLALAVIGGLSMGTLLALFMVPLGYWAVRLTAVRIHTFGQHP